MFGLNNQPIQASNGFSLNQIVPYFGLPRDYDNTDLSKIPVTQDTLQKMYQGDNAFVTALVHAVVEKMDTWHFRLCPIRRADKGLLFQYSKIHMIPSAMDLGPELTAPRMVEHSFEFYSVRMNRYTKGFQIANDFFDTPEGQQMYLRKISQLGNSWAVSLKLNVKQTVLTTSTSYARLYGAKMGAKATLEDAFSAEIRFFGAINTREKVIYLLHNESIKGMASAPTSQKPDMVVCAEGDMSFIALNSNFETESFRRGGDSDQKDIVQKRMLTAGKSMTLQGVEIFEDDTIRIEALCTRDIDFMVRAVGIGRSYTVDCHRYMDVPNFDSSAALSFQYYNVNHNDYATFHARTLVEASCRWAEDGSLHPMHSSLCDKIDSFSERTKLYPLDNHMVDPFIYKVHNAGGPYAPQKKYLPCQHVGDMEPGYLSEDFVSFYAREFKKLVDKEMTAEESKSVGELLTLSSSLYKYDMDDKVQAFHAAVMLMPGNVPEESRERWLRHEDGAPNIPYRDSSTGFIYVTDPSSDFPSPLVCVRTLLGNTSTVTNALTKMYVDGKLPSAYRVFKKPGNVGGWFPSSDDKNSKKLDRVTVITSLKGEQKVFELPTSLSVAFERCASYDRPYGYCGWNSLVYLGRLYSTGDCRGWNAQLLEIAHKGVLAVNKLFEIAKRIHPHNLSYDPENCPVHLYTGFAAIDSVCAWFQGELLKGVQQPLLGRRPSLGNEIDLSETSFGDIKLSSVSVDEISFYGEDTGFDKVSLDNDTAKAVVKGMGYNDIDVHVAEAISLLKRILKICRPNISKILLNYNKEDNTKDDVFAKYRGSGFSRLYDRFFSGRDFSEFFQKEILQWYNNHLVQELEKGATLERSAQLFQAVLTGITEDIFDVSAITSQSQLEAFINQERMTKLSERDSNISRESLHMKSTYRSSLMVEDQPDTSHAYHLTRLAVDPAYFRKIYESGNFFRVNAMVTWPSNPENPFEPLCEWKTVIDGYKREDLADWAKASGRPEGRAGGGVDYPPKGSHPLHTTAMCYHKHRADAGGETSKKRPRQPLASASASYRRGVRGRKETELRENRGGVSLGGMKGSNVGGPSAMYTHTFPTERLDINGDLTEEVFYLDPNFNVQSGVRVQTRWNLVNRLNLYASSFTDPVTQIGAQMFCQSPVNKKQWVTWLHERLSIPDSYTYADPFVVLNMASMLWGLQRSGSTIYNYENMALQFNGVNKQWTGALSTWFNAAIEKDDCIFWQDNVSFKGVVRGMDGSVNTSKSDFDPSSPMNGKKTGFVFSHGPRMRADCMPKPFWNLTGVVELAKYPGVSVSEDADKAARWDGDMYYNFFWGFHDINTTTSFDSSSFMSLATSSYVNVSMSQGRQRNWDLVSNCYGTNGRVLRGKGHLGNWVSDDVLSVLQGKLMAKSCDDLDL